jgi:nucleotide-binding universal stress UspA family protein
MRAPAKHHAPGARLRKTVHEIRSGERVDGFHVGELLHEGGMSRIYRVTHPHHRPPLAMKVPRLGAQAPVSALIAFENELRILGRLHGPYVPRLVAAGDLMESPYLVMEYVEDDELARAEATAPLPVGRLRELGARLAHAVHELHRHNVIHLDLNPSNVRTRRDGTLVLVDFGMAHHAALPDLIDAAHGEEEGTTPYIAPEQVKYLRTEPRSDVYAIGAILYRLATGSYPFGRPNLLSLRKRLFQPPPPPRWHHPDIPPWLQEVILRCLEIRPRDRYATACQVAYALAHPESVHLTRRAHRRHPAGWATRARLWLKSLTQVFDEDRPVNPLAHLAGAPHVLVALDLSHASTALRAVLRNAVRKFARSEPHGYFTFLTVFAADEADREAADAAHHAPAGGGQRLVEMRHWAQPLHLPPSRAFFQIAVGDPGSEIVDYARRHLMDYIILGARGSSVARRFLGSVSSKVVAEAPCSVTVVRSRRDAPASPEDGGGR